MIEREKYLNLLNRKLKNNPRIVILGPRQVGKTTLAKSIVDIEDRETFYYDLESQNTLDGIKIDPESFLSNHKSGVIILDEVQVFPLLFSQLRSVIDKNRINARFLLLGSANPQLVKGVSESLAGRVSYIELSPLQLHEVGYENQNKHWFRGGFPRAYLATDDESFLDWITDYIRAYVERDVNLLFHLNLNTSLIRRLWIMLAHLNGSTLNSADLGRSLGVTANTVNNYIDVLEGAFLIKKLLPWYANIGKRLVKSPKIYLADTGLFHGLLNIRTFEKLHVNPNVGASWENYVYLQISYALEGIFELYFYRTHNGSEVDLVVVDGIKPIACIEIKNSNNPSVSRGFFISIEDLKTENNYVITRDQSYSNIKNVPVLSLVDFLNIEINLLIKKYRG